MHYYGYPNIERVLCLSGRGKKKQPRKGKKDKDALFFSSKINLPKANCQCLASLIIFMGTTASKFWPLCTLYTFIIYDIGQWLRPSVNITLAFRYLLCIFICERLYSFFSFLFSFSLHSFISFAELFNVDFFLCIFFYTQYLLSYSIFIFASFTSKGLLLLLLISFYLRIEKTFEILKEMNLATLVKHTEPSGKRHIIFGIFYLNESGQLLCVFCINFCDIFIIKLNT